MQIRKIAASLIWKHLKNRVFFSCNFQLDCWNQKSCSLHSLLRNTFPLEKAFYETGKVCVWQQFKRTIVVCAQPRLCARPAFSRRTEKRKRKLQASSSSKKSLFSRPLLSLITWISLAGFSFPPGFYSGLYFSQRPTSAALAKKTRAFRPNGNWRPALFSHWPIHRTQTFRLFGWKTELVTWSVPRNRKEPKVWELLFSRMHTETRLTWSRDSEYFVFCSVSPRNEWQGHSAVVC